MKKLNFECGDDIREGWDNYDIRESASMNFDFNEFPYILKDNTYDLIFLKK